jgi:hypothetical protein
MLVHAGDTQGIDQVIQQVVALVEPLEGLSYNTFDPTCAAQWRATKARFYEDNEAIKAATRQLIDTSFRWADHTALATLACCWAMSTSSITKPVVIKANKADTAIVPCMHG